MGYETGINNRCQVSCNVFKTINMKKLYFISRLKSSEKFRISHGFLSITRRLSVVILLLFTLGFSQAVWGQTLPDWDGQPGDYASYVTTSPSDWSSLSSWVRYDGTNWVIPTTAEGYPGQYAGTGTVTIWNGDEITLNLSTPYEFDSLIVTGVSDADRSALRVYYSYTLKANTSLLENWGEFAWYAQATLHLEENAVLNINTNGRLYGYTCNNNVRLNIGTIDYAVCVGKGNALYTFDNITSGGGLLQAIASAEPEKICSGGTITLEGDTAGFLYSTATLTFKWELDGPDGNIVVSTSEDPGDITLTTPGLYTYTFTVTETIPLSGNKTFTSNTADEVQVVVMPNSLTWDGSTDGNWNSAGNWTNTDNDPTDPDNDYYVPISCTDVIIPDVSSLSSPIISTADAACNNLTIEANGELTIALGGTLTTTGNVTINSTSYDANGSLIVNGALDAGGTIKYNRHLATTRWWIASAPLNVSSGGFDGSNIPLNSDYGSYDFAWYKESDNDGWQYYLSLPSSLTLGQGYLTGTTNTGIVSFTGTLNGDFTIPVTNTPTGEEYRNGWNALGNPYTSAIGITTEAGTTEQFLAKNAAILETSYAAIYVWNETGTYDETNDQYYKAISNNGYTPYSYPGMGTLTDDYIQVGQGFLINAGGTGGNIQFTKTMQTHLPTLSLKSAKTSWPGVTLLAENGDQSRYTIVTFNEKMTAGLDKTYDAGLLASSDFILYSRLVSGDEGVDFEIQCLPDNMYSQLSVPIGLDLPKAGTVTFKAAGVILPDGIFPVLEDRLLKVFTPMKTESDSYTVNFDDDTQGAGRFFLGFTNTTSVDAFTQPDSFKAWFAHDKIVLEGFAEEGTRVSLYDISGRKLSVHRLQQINRNEIPAAALSPGVYLLKIEGKKQQQEIKVPVVY
jgi:hypothetical protein